MKTNTNTTNADALLHELIAMLRKSGTRCGTGNQMNLIRAMKR